MGLSYNKFLAKIASDLQKPRGFSIIGREEAADLSRRQAGRDHSRLGASAQNRLAKVGVTRIAHLRDVPLKTLFEALGRDSQRRLGWPGARTAGRSTGSGRRRASRRKPLLRRTALLRGSRADPVAALRNGFPAASRLPGLAGQSVTLKLKDKIFRLLTRTAQVLLRPSSPPAFSIRHVSS